MEVDFKDDDLDRLETDEKFTAKLPVGVVKGFRKRMQQIRAAQDERDFYANKGMHFEKMQSLPQRRYLRGRRRGDAVARHAIPQWHRPLDRLHPRLLSTGQDPL